MNATNAAPFMWINSFPVSGKLTLATAMAVLHKLTIILDKLIGYSLSKVSAILYRVLAGTPIVPQGVLDQYVCAPATPSRLGVFRDKATPSHEWGLFGSVLAGAGLPVNNDPGRDVAAEYKDVAQRTGRHFVPVYLSCDVDANLERVASAHRLSSDTEKLTDVNLLQDMRSNREQFCFTDHPRPGESIQPTR